MSHTWTPPEEYIASLSRKYSSAVVLFTDAAGRLLMVKPSYKETWSLPGGTIDENESPLEAARREVREEIGLEADELIFIGVEYLHKEGFKGDCYHFAFYGGILPDEEIGRITLAEGELTEYGFFGPEEVRHRLGERMGTRILAAWGAAQAGQTAYLEDSQAF